MTYQYQYFLERIAGRDPKLRAADADRERITERLRKAHAEGRLDTDEFQERLERCYEAKTFGDLEELVRDLPRPEAQIERRPLAQPRTWPGLAPVAAFLIALIIASALIAHHIFWLWIPLLFLFWRSSRRRRRWMAGPRQRPDGWL